MDPGDGTNSGLRSAAAMICDAEIIRTIGEPRLRFTEDKLRLLRAVRFAARFGYEIEAQTFAAIKKTIASDHLRFPPERLRDELTKILTEGAARRGFELLDETGLLAILLPEVARMKGRSAAAGISSRRRRLDSHTHAPGKSARRIALQLLHGALSCTTLASRPHFSPPVKTGDRIRFNGHAEIGARMAEEICRRFRFSNEDTAQITELVASHMRFKDVQQMRPSTLKRFVRSPSLMNISSYIVSIASHVIGMLGNCEFVRKVPGRNSAGASSSRPVDDRRGFAGTGVPSWSNIQNDSAGCGGRAT